MPMYICKPIGSVDTCPVTKKAWEARAELLKDECDFESDYHCLPDNEGVKWEKCIQKTLILEGNCPMYTSDGYLDWKPCDISDLSCPNSSYVSNEVYKYPWCFGDNTPRNETKEGSLYNVRDGPSLSLVMGIMAPIVLLAAAFIWLVIRRKRKLREWKKLMKGVTDSLLPENMLEEVAIRRVVDKGVIKLSENDVKSIVVFGGIGNMMSSTARYIMEKFAMRMKWKYAQYQFPKKPTTVDEKTIILVYGWFGLWNDNLCFRNEAKEVCEHLIQILKDKSEVKLILVMRSDVYSNHKGDLEKYPSLFSNKFDLNDEHLSDDYSEYFKLTTKTCKVYRCKCHELSITKLRHENDELIGIPLKVEIILEYHDHELLKSYSDNWDILTAMTDHFKALEEHEKPIYEWIMYTCLKGHFIQNGPFDQDLINEMKFRIKPSSFEEHGEPLHKYLRVWFSDSQNVSTEDARYVFWHPFIYICAFHYLYKKDRSIIMNHCNVDAIMQLVRPNSWKIDKKLSYIEVCADPADVEPLMKRLRKLGLLNKYKDHPLIKDTENDNE